MTQGNSVWKGAVTNAGRHRLPVGLALSAAFALGSLWSAAAAQLPEPIAPLPLAIAVDSARASIGERLFHDVRLARDNAQSCATCHPLDKGGAQPRRRASAATGERLPRNTPTIFNVGFNFSFNWDGAVNTLEAHAETVLLNPSVMNTTWPELLARLRADSEYVAAFRAAYGEHISRHNVLDALASFERSLVTPNSRFDRYLRGERDALTMEEQRGYQLFKSYGCVACHQGMNIGGNLFQKFGVFQAPEIPPPADGAIDPGRYGVTKVARDREVFRVPSLRNVAATAPYFHDGRAETLEIAVDTMARIQLGRQLTHGEIGLIVQFLHTLTGEWRGEPLPAGRSVTR
jgi:cytochrome c peroxidase